MVLIEHRHHATNFKLPVFVAPTLKFIVQIKQRDREVSLKEKYIHLLTLCTWIIDRYFLILRFGLMREKQ